MKFHITEQKKTHIEHSIAKRARVAFSDYDVM